MAMTMNGEPSPMMPDIEMSMEMVATTTVTDEYVALAAGQPKKLSRSYDAVGSELEMDVVINMMGEEESQSPNGSGTSELEGSTVIFTWNDEDGEYELSFPRVKRATPISSRTSPRTWTTARCFPTGSSPRASRTISTSWVSWM